MDVVNTGRTALRIEEMDSLLSQTLKNSPNARIYVIEALSPIPEPLRQTSQRQIAWHSLDSTLMLIDAAWADCDLTFSEKCSYSGRHLQLAALHYGLYGSISTKRSQQGDVRNPSRSDDRWKENHERELAQIAQGEFQRRYKHSRRVALLYERIIAKIRKAGALPVFVIMPQGKWNDFGCLDVLSDYVGECPLIDLGSPSKNPEFYDISLWIDPYHVGGEGADLLSQKLVNELLRVLRS